MKQDELPRLHWSQSLAELSSNEVVKLIEVVDHNSNYTPIYVYTGARTADWVRRLNSDSYRYHRHQCSSLGDSMSSYLRGWFSLETAAPVATPQPESDDIPEILHVSPPPSDGEDEGEDTEREDDDVAPAFPALNSAQRASSSAKSGIPSFLTDTQRMPPPSLPGLAVRQPGTSGLTLPPSSRVSSLSPNSLSPGATTQKPPKKSKKVALAPGHGALDWASLKSSGADLRVRHFFSQVLHCLMKIL